MLPPGVNSESCPVFEYAIFHYGLRLGVGSGQYHRKQKSHWMDECIEWQVNYGYQKSHGFLI